MPAPTFHMLMDHLPHAPGAATGHGLSIWIDTGSTRILFDTGQSGAFLENAVARGIDLATADHLVLSHGHYDHTGGLAALEGVLPSATPLHAHPGIGAARYSRHADGTVHAIGIPRAAQDFLRARAACFHPVTATTAIAPSVWLSGPVPRKTAFEDTGGDFWLDAACTTPDPIEDDLSLWIEHDNALWIFLGCAHAGAVNIIEHVRRVSGIERVHAIIGGTHLRAASSARLAATAAYIERLAPEIFLPCHCSGTGILDAWHARKATPQS